MIKDPKKPLCISCKFDLPLFEEESLTHNSVAKSFWGRIPAKWVSCYLQLKPSNAAQQILHALKYDGNQDVGLQMALSFAKHLKNLEPTLEIDVVVPMPLHPKKLSVRGYNQCTVLARGISEEFNCSLIEDAIIKTKHVSSQTKKSRQERWGNIKGSFQCIKPWKFKNKKVLLIDDVITTGATMEACALSILNIDGVEISLAGLAYAP
ncbi:MAG: ComF family protein [Bacteroidia bacterium]